MNHALSTVVTTTHRERPTTPLRRAFALEREHHQALVGFYGLLAVAVSQLSVFGGIHLGFVLAGAWWVLRVLEEGGPSAGDPSTMIATSATAQWITMALALGSAILVLLWRRRRWIRTA